MTTSSSNQFKIGDKVRVAANATYRIDSDPTYPVWSGIINAVGYVISGPDGEGDFAVAPLDDPEENYAVSPQFLTLAEDDSSLVRWDPYGNELRFLADVEGDWVVIQSPEITTPKVISRKAWLLCSTTEPPKVPEGWSLRTETDPLRNALKNDYIEVRARRSCNGYDITTDYGSYGIPREVFEYLEANRAAALDREKQHLLL